MSGPLAAARKSNADSCSRLVEAYPSVNRLDPASRNDIPNGSPEMACMISPYPTNIPPSQLPSMATSTSGASQARTRSRGGYPGNGATSSLSRPRIICQSRRTSMECIPRGTTIVRSTLANVTTSSTPPASPEIHLISPIMQVHATRTVQQQPQTSAFELPDGGEGDAEAGLDDLD